MTLAAFIVVLGILVIAHEYGHFQAARWAGVRVEIFSIGFGPQLFKIERGGTIYRVAAIPLGGYVKMAGDEPTAENAAITDGYFAQPIWKRAGIVLAGPAMNILLAFALAPLMYLIGVPEPIHLTEAPTIGWVADDELNTQIVAGDVVLAVNGSAVGTWRDLQNALAISRGTMQLTLARGDDTFDVVTERAAPGDLIGVLVPPMDTVVERVMPDGAAAAAGIAAGDRIVAIDGQAIEHWLGIRQALDAATAPTVAVVVARAADVTAEVVVAPKLDDAGRPMLGVARQENSVMRRYGLGEAISLGNARVVDMFGLTFIVLQKLFTGQLGLDALGGPLMIAQGAGDAARQGAGALLVFMIFISVQLGVLNLLPIPVLDGGHLVLLGAEALFGRRLPDKVVAALQYLGFAALMLLILYVTRNDIMRMWGEPIRRWLEGW